MPDPDTAREELPPNTLRLKRLGIDTRQEHVIYMRADCPVCRAEGFVVHARVQVAANGRSIIASVHHLLDSLLEPDQASLSESAWRALAAAEGEPVSLSHPPPIESLAYVRAKLYGRTLTPEQFDEIVGDMAAGRYSDIELSAFIAGCAGQRLDESEIVGLTRAMIDAGDRLEWGKPMIVDKHCVGGLPGNRTTPIVVPIVAANGLTMPKTSSRAITSPAGTADTMEMMAPVELELAAMRRVVEQTGGCIVWGGAVRLSPADDVLIRGPPAPPTSTARANSWPRSCPRRRRRGRPTWSSTCRSAPAPRCARPRTPSA
jgi:thymidine phosphorylase